MNRVIVSKSGDGFFNLATDEYLLERCRSGELGGVTLYFFVNSDSVIIGRNQNAFRECAVEKMEEDGIRLVRRHTGGGAVFHDEGNLNFSFIADERVYSKERQNRVVLSALARLGVGAELSGRNDFTVEGRKISGCAYAVSGIARGMHGTLLVDTDMTKLSNYLRPSKLKLKAKGVTSVRARVANLCDFVRVSVDEVRDAIIETFREEYGDCGETVVVRSCGDVVRAYENSEGLPYARTINGLYEKQSSWEWRFGSAPEFDCSIEAKLSFGEIQLAFKVKNGVVRSYGVFTDSLDTELPAKLGGLLDGVRFEKHALAAALKRGGAEAKELAEYILAEGGTDMPDRTNEELVVGLRRSLHTVPELSGLEKRTKAMLIDFLKEHTSIGIVDMGRWFYAKHDEGAGRTVAVRADFDAVGVGCAAKHLCGHDGHSAALCGLALLLEGRTVGVNVILLFQHAEETGEGAEECLALFDKEKVDAVIGAHNIPGEPLGAVLLRRGTFACASCGMEIGMLGRPTHAAYPENGLNPVEALSRLVLSLPEITGSVSKNHACMTLSTVVGLNAGERAFGVAASEGTLFLTLRAERTEALDELVRRTADAAARLADEVGLTGENSLCDVFPATVNDEKLLDSIEKICSDNGLTYRYLEEPFRWSEDFGHYAERAPSVFFGIGSGEDTAPLHTERYEYPDSAAFMTAEVFFRIVSGLK